MVIVRAPALVLGLGSLVLLAACGGPGAVAPTAPRFDPKSLWREQSRGPARPMVVDWDAPDRGTLESHAKQGVIVVRFDEAGLEPLWDCAIPKGRYRYTGVSPKRDHVDASSEAELAANFPIGWKRFGAKVGGGEAVSADIRMVGVAELDRPVVYRDELAGSCAGATHFVKELTVGGFRFGSMARAAAEGGASVGVVGVDAGYSGISKSLQEEGDLGACEKADSSLASAPDRCNGILRLRLSPIAARAAGDAPPPKAAEARPTCGAGLVWDGSGCVGERKVAAPAPASGPLGQQATVARGGHECTGEAFTDCEAQCRAGNAASCRHTGELLLVGANGAPRDVEGGLRLLDLLCDKVGDADACFQAGAAYTDLQKHDRAAAASERGCQLGSAQACTNFAVMKTFGRGTPEDRGLAFQLNDRACRLGEWVACNNAGAGYLLGRTPSGQRDSKRARELFAAACESGEKGGCGNYAVTLEIGAGGPADHREAVKLYAASCEAGNAFACVWGGLLTEAMTPGAEGVKKALPIYERACQMPPGGGCLGTKELEGLVHGAWTPLTIDRHACDGGEPYALACYNAAYLHSAGAYVPKNLDLARRELDRACKGSMAKACDTLKDLDRAAGR
jgi:hypothetical protein